MAELTVPQVDFSSLGQLPAIYKQGQADAVRQQTLASLGQGGTADAAALLRSGDLSLAQLGMTIQQREAEAKRQASQDARQAARDAVGDKHWAASYELQKQAAARAGEDKFTIKEVTNPDGTTGLVRVKTTGGEGPISGTTSSPVPRKLSISDIGKLSEEGQKYSTLNSVSDKFEDRFGGYLPGTGDANMTAGRLLPQGLVGKDRAEGASFWQEYDRYKNVVRNELFGASLTAGESKAFAQADISPSMQPAQIRKNLAIQKGLVQSAMKRKADAAITSGYDPKAIGQAYGIDVGPGKTGGITQADYEKLPSGTPFTAPDGSQRIKP
jgi:hypothetical protein